MSSTITGGLTAQNIEVLDRISNDVLNDKLREKQQLGKDAFLELMMTQLSNQDPLEPMDNAAMIEQMATFSSVEQLGAISDSMEVEKQTSQSILEVLRTMSDSSLMNASTDSKIDELILKTDQSYEVNKDILNELINLNKALGAYGE